MDYISGSFCLVLTTSCPTWLVCPGCFFFCCHRLVLITTFQNMRSSMLSFGNHVGNELYALKIVVLNARVSIGFTFRRSSIHCFATLQFVVFFFKISIMTCLLQMEFSFGCLARLVVWFHLVISSLFLLSFCICYSYNPHFMSTVSGCFNSFKQLQCLLFLGFESKMIINYSSLMRVWNVQSNSFPFIYLSCFSHCVGVLISNLSVVMPLIGVE